MADVARPRRCHNGGVIIRAPREDELPGLVELEAAAQTTFGEPGGIPEIAGDEPWPVEWLQRFTTRDRAWVALADGDDVPVAYLVAEPVDGFLHVEQVSVHPRAARHGFGRALIDHLAAVAREDGVPALTLTTFADVPWNAPYYARLGFTVIDEGSLTAGLRRIREREATRGLEIWPRVVMRRPVTPRR